MNYLFVSTSAWLLAVLLPYALAAQDAVSATQRGLEMMNQGRYQEAEAHLLRAFEIAGRENATAVYNLASLRQRQGRFQEAERLHRTALGRWEQERGPFSPEVAQSLNDLGALYRALGRYSQAIEVLQRATEILDRNPTQKFACSVLSNLANTYSDVGEYGEAIRVARRALALAESGNYEDRSTLGYILNSLGTMYFKQKDYGEAETTLLRAVRTFADTLGSQHQEYGLALTNLALVYNRQRRFRDALPLLQEAIETLERSSGPEAPILAGSLYAYADVMKGLGRKSEARQIARRAKAMDNPETGTIDIRLLTSRKGKVR
jgi:tetratricopeptide (TPR) repeat protein